jgi:hypothetical protein
VEIYLDDEDCPNADDRAAAVRIVQAIALKDVLAEGSVMVEGYRAARRIARALTAARADERRRGFETPMPMRKTVPAKGAPAVMAKWRGLRPLYHWLEIEAVRFQSYRAKGQGVLLISDDARIEIERQPDFWTAHVDGKQVIACGAVRRFESENEAITAALERMRADDRLRSTA